MQGAIDLLERGLLPDPVIRWGIRRLLGDRLRQEDRGNAEANRRAQQSFIEELKRSPVAIATDKANEQHYELPPGFFQTILGPRLKYSSCLWSGGVRDLGAAEEAMLKLTCERAAIADGMDILELGCGWGSLTLWMAEMYPGARITSVSNSKPQREFIEGVCAQRGFRNVRVITADMNDFAAEGRFDRVVSVEMFEHMRNYRELMKRIASWLKPGGKLFVHIFVHRAFSYPFETEGASNWMGRYFFTGGIMPSDDLLLHFQEDLVIEDHWRVNGRHYEKTLLAWLDLMDRARATVMPVMEQVYGAGEALKWFVRWRVFMLACAGLFGYRGGEEWFVSHYLFRAR